MKKILDFQQIYLCNLVMNPLVELFRTIKEIKHLSYLMIGDFLGVPVWIIELVFVMLTLIPVCKLIIGFIFKYFR